MCTISLQFLLIFWSITSTNGPRNQHSSFLCVSHKQIHYLYMLMGEYERVLSISLFNNTITLLLSLLNVLIMKYISNLTIPILGQC